MQQVRYLGSEVRPPVSSLNSTPSQYVAFSQSLGFSVPPWAGAREEGMEIPTQATTLASCATIIFISISWSVLLTLDKKKKKKKACPDSQFCQSLLKLLVSQKGCSLPEQGVWIRWEEALSWLDIPLQITSCNRAALHSAGRPRTEG